MKKIPLLPPAVALLCFTAYASSLTAQNPISIAQSTSQNLLTLAQSIEAIAEAPSKTEVVVISHHYEDVENGIWYEQAIDYVVSHQIMSPLNDKLFAPDNAITRGILATVFTNAEQAELGEMDTIFQDLAYQWYHDSAHWVVEQGIMTGFPNEIFGGNEPVLREQLAIMLYRYAEYKGNTPQTPTSNPLNYASDGGEVSSYAQVAVAWCLNEGIFPKEDSVRPKENASRGEVAFAIAQLLK